MTPRDERGRFTRGPVLHRQVAAKPENDAIWQPEPAPSRWPWVFFVGALAVVAVMGLFLMGAR